MSDPMTALAAGGGLISGVGTLASAGAARAQGAAQQAEYNYKAAQEDQQATQAIAAGQRQEFDTERKTALTQSTLQARSAGDGGTSTDGTVLDLSQDIAGRGELFALDNMYDGQNKAVGLQQQAAADRYSGAVARQGASLASTGTLLSGIGSLASRFGSLRINSPDSDP